MSPPRRRSARSRAVEFGLAVVVVLVIWLLLVNGGPAAFGNWFAGQIHMP